MDAVKAIEAVLQILKRIFLIIWIVILIFDHVMAVFASEPDVLDIRIVGIGLILLWWGLTAIYWKLRH